MSTISAYSKSKREEVERKKLQISYKFVEHNTDYFFLHGLSSEYYEHLTKTFEKIQNITEDDLRLQRECEGLKPKTLNFDAPNITQKSFSINEASLIYSFIKNKTRIENQTDDKKTIQDNLKEFIKNAFELRISTNLGRIHGFVYQNIFYIIWFDPAHNLYLTKHLGMQQRLKLPHEIESIKPICPTQYQEYNKKLKEIESYITEMLDQMTEQ